MKVLLDVIKTLLLINGAFVIPSLFLIMALYEQQSTSLTAADDVSSKFHRNIQDDTPKYEQKLKRLEAQRNQLQAKLEASKEAQTVKPVLADNGSSVQGNPTKVSSDSQPQNPANRSQSSGKRSVEAEVATASSTRVPPKSLRKLVVNSSKPEEALIEQQRTPTSVHEVNVIAHTITSDDWSADHQSSDQQGNKTAPKGFVSVAELNKTHQPQGRLISHSITAPQAKTPIDQPITLANDLSVGLIVAHNRNELNYSTKNYKRVQTAILSLRKGNSQTLEEAAQKASIDPDTLKWLAHYGQNRPG